MTKELKMIYDYCDKKRDVADKNADKTKGYMSMLFDTKATVYWEIMKLIETNFEKR